MNKYLNVFFIHFESCFVCRRVCYTQKNYSEMNFPRTFLIWFGNKRPENFHDFSFPGKVFCTIIIVNKQWKKKKHINNTKDVLYHGDVGDVQGFRYNTHGRWWDLKWKNERIVSENVYRSIIHVSLRYCTQYESQL